MKIPSWYRDVDRRFKLKQDRMQQEAIRNAPWVTIKDAPTGWALLPEYPMYQVVPDAQYPWDVDVVKAMRTVDPRVVPLWVTWAYRPPKDCPDKGVFVTGRHAIGLAIDDPKVEQHDFSCLMPTTPIGGMTFKRPTVIHKIYHVASTTEEIIGDFVPYSWWMYYNLREEFVGDKPEAMTGHEYVEKAREEYDAREEQRRKERIYMFQDVNNFVHRKLKDVPEHVWKSWLSGGNEQFKA